MAASPLDQDSPGAPVKETGRQPESAGTDPPPDRAGFLGWVAHEVRNPLSTALWTAELMARLDASERGGARGEKLAALCLRSLGRVRLLVEDHLLCERLDAGGYPVRAEAVPLEAALEAVLARGPAGASPVRRILPPGLAVKADPVLLERALEGLVAAAAAGEAPVAIEAQERGARVVLRVTGAPPPALRDPAKGDPSESRGRGLALPVARRVAAALGGSLSVDGSALVLDLPAGPAAP